MSDQNRRVNSETLVSLFLRKKVFIFVCAHMCTGAHEQMYVSAEAKGQLKCLPQLLFTIFFGTRPLLKLEACELATLGDQQTAGILLPVPHQHWVYRLCGWGSTLRSSPLSSQPLPPTAVSLVLLSLDLTIAKVIPWRKALETCSRVRQEAVLVTNS